MYIGTIILLCLIIAAGWLARLDWLFKRKGFDPSLVTYADPLASFSHWGYRLVMILILATSWLNGSELKLVQLLGLGMALSALAHVGLLVMFNRAPTQPSGYYLVISLAGLLLAGWPTARPAAIVIWLASEIWLIYWQRTSQRRYDQWVAKLAARIDKRYRKLAQSMPASDWRWVLHIAVTESIARPKLVRAAERLYFRLKKPAYISTGIMQIRDVRPLSDTESLHRGAAIIRQLLPNMPRSLSESQQIVWLARHYNGSGGYAQYLQAVKSGLDLFHHHSARMMHVGRHR